MSKGFSLVELSVALIVLAIIASIVSLGASMIEQARIRALISSLGEYRSIINAYRDQYSAIPGDHANAFSIWGTSCAASATLCNGNGNGIIEWQNSVNDVESVRAWQHLFLSGFLETSYPGTSAVSGQSDIGVNIPLSPWPNAGIEFYTQATTPSGINGLAVQVAGATANAAASSANIMTPLQAWTIDKKIDDGAPATGIVLGYLSGSTSTCVSSSSEYNTTLKQRVCYIKYLLLP